MSARNLACGGALLVAFAAACSSSVTKVAPLQAGDDDDSSGDDSGGGPGATNGDGSVGGTGITGGDGGGSIASDGAADDTDAPYDVSQVCTALTFAPGTRVSLAMPSFASFGGITPSPTSIAWIDTGGTVYVADRNQTFDPFTTTTVQAGSAASASAIRSQLDVLGSTMYVTLPDNSGLTAYGRILPGNPFDPPTTTGLAAINGQLSTAGAHVAEFAIGGFANTMFVLAESTGTQGAFTLYESTLGKGETTWPAASTHTEAALRSSAGARRVPTGVSFDGRVLFYYDETTSTEMAATRTGGSGDFTAFQSIGSFAGAAPVQNCSGIFYVGTDGNGAGVFSDWVDPSAPTDGG